METNKPFDTSQLEFHILPGNPGPGFNDWPLYNLAYEHFREIWDRTFTRRAGQGVFDNYAFFRQSLVFVITNGKEIVAEICGSFLHLESNIIQNLSYFENFKGKAEEMLNEMNAKTLMTLELSATNPKYSPRKVDNICFGEIVTYLGTMCGFAAGADATTGLPRRVTGTNDKVVNSGYRRIETSKARLGLAVDVVVCFRADLIPHREPVMRELIERLWRSKKNLTNFSLYPNATVPKEAYHDASSAL